MWRWLHGSALFRGRSGDLRLRQRSGWRQRLRLRRLFRFTEAGPRLLEHEPQGCRVCQQGGSKHGIPYVLEEVIAVADERCAEHQRGRKHKGQINTAQDAEEYLCRKEVAVMHLGHDIPE